MADSKISVLMKIDICYQLMKCHVLAPKSYVEIKWALCEWCGYACMNGSTGMFVLWYSIIMSHAGVFLVCFCGFSWIFCGLYSIKVKKRKHFCLMILLSGCGGGVCVCVLMPAFNYTKWLNMFSVFLFCIQFYISHSVCIIASKPSLSPHIHTHTQICSTGHWRKQSLYLF